MDNVTLLQTGSPYQRLYFLDWLRVIAVVLVLYFHTGMMFVAEWEWHIKDQQTSYIFMEWMYFLSRWRMSLLFLVSGAASYFVLRSVTTRKFIWERFKRLLIPLAFGMFVIVPPQIYMERLTQGESYASYLDFYPSVLNFQPYPEGNFSWHHLWFILYLFLYSLIALPVFLFFKSAKGKSAAGYIVETLKKVSIYIWALPIAVVVCCLIFKYPGPQNLINDWAMFWKYFILYVLGFLFNVHPWFWQEIEDKRKLSLKLGFVCLIVINYFRWNNLEPEGETILNHLFRSLSIFNVWCWILALLGYGKKYLNFTNRFLQYANEGIYPFYILHQTVIVVIGYYALKIDEGILLEFLFISTVSLLLTLGIYDFFIRPYRFTRFLFGMKTKPHDK